ncbi:hypothetical protein J6590_034019 [Homalodisca vitripennis]|nr:hypothetical protein J6590_034019 [Homalodisca vitripennis]
MGIGFGICGVIENNRDGRGFTCRCFPGLDPRPVHLPARTIAVATSPPRAPFGAACVGMSMFEGAVRKVKSSSSASNLGQAPQFLWCPTREQFAF